MCHPFFQLPLIGSYDDEMSGLDSSTPSSNVRSNGFPTEGHPSPSGSQSSEGIPPTDGYGPVGTVSSPWGVYAPAPTNPSLPASPHIHSPTQGSPIVEREDTPANNTGVTTAALSTPITGFDMSNPPHTQFSDAPPPADSVIRSLANSLQQIQTQNGPRRAASVPVVRDTAGDASVRGNHQSAVHHHMLYLTRRLQVVGPDHHDSKSPEDGPQDICTVIYLRRCTSPAVSSTPVTRETIHVNGLPHPHGLDGLHLTNQSHTSSGPPSGSLPPPPPPESVPYLDGDMSHPSQSAAPYPPPPGYPPSNHGWPPVWVVPSQDPNRQPIPFPTHVSGTNVSSHPYPPNPAPSQTVLMPYVPVFQVPLSEEGQAEIDVDSIIQPAPRQVSDRRSTSHRVPNADTRRSTSYRAPNADTNQRHDDERQSTSRRHREVRSVSSSAETTGHTKTLGSHGPTDGSLQVGREGFSAKGTIIKFSGHFQPQTFSFNLSVEDNDHQSTSRHQSSPTQPNTVRADNDTVPVQAPPEKVTAGEEGIQRLPSGLVVAAFMSFVVALRTLSPSSLDSRI
ncbi:hypothetical protein TREMEDRAFT_59518 [Tremella mesenterica DSM 1558]|uniref:uncharacterized protein n=1 Tax=Tremella mesenterica (strain ATCC 24925 / CBS 8224 / DSM 1558 / NBRC 9311 / NRRL Y-6157 / RJB 2259-6 / UBC 559-6) TaxID=578456 RepID=UPI0003F49633|nr:uncharacterized protein TREMEDRAFT_59518 [Tremella mesenterica DSM 1558]EIW73352.1 hypothetical protein TREMEDRAFT_59518 [Tremella mesenterica DSM 1558]